MPKFFCNRCGSLMDTGEAFAPTELSCPACRSEVESSPRELPPMPSSADQQAPVTPPPAAQVQPPHPEPPAREAPSPDAKSWKPLVRRAVAATLIGGTLSFAGTYLILWKAGGKHPDHLLGGWIGASMVMAGAGVSFGLIAALIMLAFKRPFGRSFANAYSLSVLAIALLSVTGGLLSSGANRRQQAQEKESQEDTKESLDRLREDLEK